ncbi:tetR family transcriptional regulator-like protein [Burkholderia pseudomallei MSHR7334]|nr:tetR family transcriptional regulator-like protein [Burkholderia pseudomallei MSHR7334]
MRAFLRVEKEGLQMSVTAVAAQVGVSPTLIHNTYPDIAAKIRVATGRTTRQLLDAKTTELADARRALTDLREELRQATEDIGKLASINETLRDEITLLRAQVADKVRVMPTRK